MFSLGQDSCIYWYSIHVFMCGFMYLCMVFMYGIYVFMCSINVWYSIHVFTGTVKHVPWPFVTIL